MDIVEFTENIVKELVKHPELIKVQKFETEEEKDILEILVSQEDMGEIIGKGGKMINSIRTIVMAFAYLKGLKKIQINVDAF